MRCVSAKGDAVCSQSAIGISGFLNSMSIDVSPANLDHDRTRIINALAKWLTPRSDERRYDWLYREGPYGPADVWLAVRREDGSVVGAAAAFPRRMYVGGSQMPACVYGDFFVASEQRSLGLALRLQRACLGHIETGHAAIAYDFPSASMMAIYQRLRTGSRNTMVRLAKPLRANRKVREILRFKPLVGVVSAAANAVLAMRNRVSQGRSHWEIVPLDGNCGEEFTTLASGIGSSRGNCVVRRADYLNWRYLSHPFCRYQILTARRRGRLEGYVAFCHQDDDGKIVDLFGIESEDMFASLLAEASRILRALGVTTLSMPILSGHSRIAGFERSGFRRRESCDVVLHARPDSGATVAASSDWFLMDGDRDS